MPCTCLSFTAAHLPHVVGRVTDQPLQIAVGMATVQNGRSGKPHFIARWIIKPRHSGNASYKQQMGGRGVFIRNSFDTAVTFPELQGYGSIAYIARSPVHPTAMF